MGRWLGAAGRGRYRRGKRSGKWILNAAEYRTEGEFKKGKRSGLWSYYDSTGMVYASGRFKAGRPIGKWTHREGHAACPWHDETDANSSSYSDLVFKNGRRVTADGEALEGSDWFYVSTLFVERAELATAYD